MAFDGFIQISGIEGESTDEKHPNWIEIISYNSGVSQTVSSTASSVGGASAERADFEEFTFTKHLDISSPKLAIACADGTHIDTIIVELCRAGTSKVQFMEYKMTNCLISSISTAGGGEFPTEDVAINFGKIEWNYTKQKRHGGGPAGSVASGWDLQTNRKV